MASKMKRIEAPIEGALGEKVNVGDTVMVVTTGWGNTYVAKGKYLGYVEGTGWYKQRAQVEIHNTRNAWMTPDGKEFDWRTDYNSATYEDIKHTLTLVEVPYTRLTTLNLNRIATIKD